MRYTAQQFDAAIAALIEKPSRMPPELQDLTREELKDLVGRLIVAACFIMKQEPDDAECTMPLEELSAFLAGLLPEQRRKLKAIARSMTAEKVRFH
jgi:hypothetical protein